MRVLVVPPAAQRDENAVQMLSAWIAENSLHCTMNVGMWSASGLNEPEAWGKLLADVVRHLSNALHEQQGVDRESSIEAIVDSLLNEVNEPTSPASGHFSAGHS